MAYPTYVVRNDSNGNEGVFHQECLLLWIAADADKNDGMRSNPAIAIQVADRLVEGDMRQRESGAAGRRLRPELGHVQDDVRSPPPQDRPDGRGTTFGGGTERSWPGNL